MLTAEEIKAYLHRIGICDIESPTRSFLFALHRAHVTNVPWETVDIYAGRSVSIDVNASIAHILRGRSGYCFHLNGAFSILLRALGYQVFLHRAGVQPRGEDPRINSFHVGMTVNLLNEAGEKEIWIADVGLGDMPYEPLPLKAGEYLQGPFLYKVAASSVAPNGWRLEHDPTASFVGVDVAPEVVHDMGTFRTNHEYYSISADSPWMNVFLVRQRNAVGSFELRGCMLSERNSSGIVKSELQFKTQWLDALGDIFGERLVDYDSIERDALWKRVYRSHEEWKKTNMK
ncbi:arylamine N-acetyltransferase family protein [Paenibacillus spongiae]|uniref:Arylamine N-acetyltransferase n=1 Tax=Paenibacillus spongiae TaxID=2909671 RepID=A0ABY5S6P2_9BACL|nr:arylamine N-acetyltransferase [Paenibacillus spongiae]UVI29255.1 arylamine N-acetyltransferase [Paenibacillus spongiae]